MWQRAHWRWHWHWRWRRPAPCAVSGAHRRGPAPVGPWPTIKIGCRRSAHTCGAPCRRLTARVAAPNAQQLTPEGGFAPAPAGIVLLGLAVLAPAMLWPRWYTRHRQRLLFAVRAVRPWLLLMAVFTYIQGAPAADVFSYFQHPKHVLIRASRLRRLAHVGAQ